MRNLFTMVTICVPALLMASACQKHSPLLAGLSPIAACLNAQGFGAALEHCKSDRISKEDKPQAEQKLASYMNDPDGQKRLLYAVYVNDKAAIDKELASGIKPSLKIDELIFNDKKPESKGMTYTLYGMNYVSAVEVAYGRGDMDLVKRLIKAGGDPNLVSLGGTNAFGSYKYIYNKNTGEKTVSSIDAENALVLFKSGRSLSMDNLMSFYNATKNPGVAQTRYLSAYEEVLKIAPEGVRQAHLAEIAAGKGKSS